MAVDWHYIACQRSNKAEDIEGGLDCREEGRTQQAAHSQ
jgi:hypothetical protein